MQDDARDVPCFGFMIAPFLLQHPFSLSSCPRRALGFYFVPLSRIVGRVSFIPRSNCRVSSMYVYGIWHMACYFYVCVVALLFAVC